MIAGMVAGSHDLADDAECLQVIGFCLVYSVVFVLRMIT